MPRNSQSQTQESSSSASLSYNEEHHINNMIKTILNLSINKSMIKRKDIINIALKGDTRLYNSIIEEVKDILHEVYGYRLITVENKTQKAMILCSTIETSSLLQLSDAYRRKYTFLYLVLGYMYMKHDVIAENVLWQFLETVGIHEQKEHAYFKDTRKLLEEFIKQSYIHRFKQSIDGVSDEHVFLSWGVRAEHEVSKREVLNTISKIMGRKPTDFKTQYIETHELANATVEEMETE